MAAQVQEPLSSDGLSKPLLPLIRVLLLAALVIDTYLAWISLTEGSVAGCGPDSNCHTVLTSRWASWFGIPVSAAGLVIYACLLGGTFLTNPRSPADQRRRTWQILIFCAATTLGAGLWFICVQAFILRTFCPYCMTAHGCAMIAAGLILSQAPIRPPPEKPKQRAKQAYVPPSLVLRLCLAAAASLGLLVLGQILHRPTTYASTPITAGVTTNAAAPAVRTFQIFDGQFQFNLQDVPVIGRVDAPHLIVSLFDYTCHHCREVHGPLMEAQRRFSNELAIISLPMPLDGKCNPIVKRTQAAHTNACALARIGLSVWRAKRSASLAFDEWAFASPMPPQPEAAEARARQLVGTNAFDQAVTNLWIGERIRQDADLYKAVYQRFHKGMMPQVIVGTNLLSGVFSQDQLLRVLSEQFGLSAKP